MLLIWRVTLPAPWISTSTSRGVAGARAPPSLDRCTLDGDLGLALDPVRECPAARRPSTPDWGLSKTPSRGPSPRSAVHDEGGERALEEGRSRPPRRRSRARFRSPGHALDAEGEVPPSRVGGRVYAPPLTGAPEERHANSTSTFTARPARSSSIAAGSSSRPIRCVISGSRSSRPSSSATAAGKTSCPTNEPMIVSSSRVIRSWAISARARALTPKSRTALPSRPAPAPSRAAIRRRRRRCPRGVDPLLAPSRRASSARSSDRLGDADAQPGEPEQRDEHQADRGPLRSRARSRRERPRLPDAVHDRRERLHERGDGARARARRSGDTRRPELAQWGARPPSS